MRLSVCCLAAADPERTALTLGPLRDIADEIVIGYDREIDDARAAQYRIVADRAVPLALEHPERALVELHALCSGEWILRLDDEELASARLLAELPSLLDRPTVQQYAIARRWLTPEGDAWIDERPWWPDWQLALLRNPGGVRLDWTRPGLVEPVGPLGHVDAPIYRLTCALVPAPERAERAAVTNALYPPPDGIRERSSAARLEPERFASGRIAAVPTADREAITASLGRPLAFASEPAGPDEPIAHATALERDLRFHPSELRAVAFRLTNASDRVWSSAARPPIRASCRLTAGDGTVRDGPRTPLEAPLAPGESAVVAIDIVAPSEPGTFVLAAGVVEEGRSWLAQGEDLVARVVEPRPLPVRREHRPAARSEIPRVLHQVWLGERPMPERYRAWAEGWQRLHPHWEYRLWTDVDAPVLPAAGRARNVIERTDIVRYELLRREGGVYVDADVECVQPIDDLLEGVRLFAAYEVPGRLCNALMGGVAGHPAFEQMVALYAITVGRGRYPSATATDFLTQVLEPCPDATLFGPERFYPHLWEDAPTGPPYAEGTYAVHHWARDWLDQPRAKA